MAGAVFHCPPTLDASRAPMNEDCSNDVSVLSCTDAKGCSVYQCNLGLLRMHTHSHAVQLHLAARDIDRQQSAAHMTLTCLPALLKHVCCGHDHDLQGECLLDCGVNSCTCILPTPTPTPIPTPKPCTCATVGLGLVQCGTECVVRDLANPTALWLCPNTQLDVPAGVPD